jgi:hypothetical protein
VEAGKAGDSMIIASCSIYWLYWYKSTNTDAEGAARTHERCTVAEQTPPVLSLLALLVQKYKY